MLRLPLPVAIIALFAGYLCYRSLRVVSTYVVHQNVECFLRIVFNNRHNRRFKALCNAVSRKVRNGFRKRIIHNAVELNPQKVSAPCAV